MIALTYALVSISPDMPPALPILARPASALLLCHGPHACPGALIHCSNPGKSFPQPEKGPLCKLSPTLQIVTYTDAGVEAMCSVWKCCSENFLLAFLCVAQSWLFGTSIH